MRRVHGTRMDVPPAQPMDSAPTSKLSRLVSDAGPVARSRSPRFLGRRARDGESTTIHL